MATTRPVTIKPSLSVQQKEFLNAGTTKPLVKGRTAPDGFSRLTVNLPKELHRSLKVKAAQEDRNIGDIVVQLLDEYLKARK